MYYKHESKSASMVIGINDQDLEHKLIVSMLKSVYCYVRLAVLFHYYFISVN